MNWTSKLILFVGMVAACGAAAPATTLISESPEVSEIASNRGSSKANRREGTASQERSLDQESHTRQRVLSLDQVRFTGEDSSSEPEELGSPSELAWRAWLLVDGGESEDQSGFDSSSLGRRITPKSVFIAPALLPACAEGYHADHMKRCVKNSVIFDSLAHSNFLLDRLNAMHPAPAANPETGAATGPLQVNIPLGLKSVADDTKDENDWVIVEPEESVEISMIDDFETPPRRSLQSPDETKSQQESARFPMDVETTANIQPTNDTDESKVRQEHHTEEEPQESAKIFVVEDFVRDERTGTRNVSRESEYNDGSPLAKVNSTLKVQVPPLDSKAMNETDGVAVMEEAQQQSAKPEEMTTNAKGELELEATTTPLQVNVPLGESSPTESEAVKKGEMDDEGEEEDDDGFEEVSEESVEISTIRGIGNESKADGVKEVAATVTIYEVGNATDSGEGANAKLFLGNSTVFDDASTSDVVIPVAEFVADDNQTFGEIVDYKVSESPVEATTTKISHEANSVHSIQDYKRRAAYQQATNARSPTNTKSNVPLQQKKSYWWLPPGWRVDPAAEPRGPRNPWNSRDPSRPMARQRVVQQQQNSEPENPTLLRFWARMPLVRDPSIQQLPTPRQRNHRSSSKRSNNLYQDGSARDINRVAVGQQTQRTLGG